MTFAQLDAAAATASVCPSTVQSDPDHAERLIFTTSLPSITCPARPPPSPFTRLWPLKIVFGCSGIFFWHVHSWISALPTHLGAEDKVVMICQDQFVLENCHSTKEKRHKACDVHASEIWSEATSIRGEFLIIVV